MAVEVFTSPSHLSNPFFSDRDEEGYFASKSELPGGLDPNEMGRYWSKHREFIRQRALSVEERNVVTRNYIASYHDDLTDVFAVLDELAEEAQMSSPCARQESATSNLPASL